MRESSESKQPLEWEAARQIVIDTVRALQTNLPVEDVPLAEAHGRVLAQAVSADRDYPALRRSLRDGFAVRSTDLPGTLQARGEVRAGDRSEPRVEPGQAVEIMTGAPVPADADAVVMIEHITRDGLQIKIDRTAEPGQFINEQGAEAHQGLELISQGTLLDSSHIATLAMTGNAIVKVYRPKRVAILATGDEIVELAESPAPHQIRNSNSYMLASLVRAAGAAPTILSIARDTSQALRPLLDEGLTHDMLIVSGGISAGKYDLVKPALRDLGSEFHFERVRVQPGQPTAFATCAGRPVFGLPGNPGSTLITFQLFARVAIELINGHSDPLLPLLSAIFEAPFRHKPGLTRFLPARLSPDGSHLRHIPWQGSSDIPALAKANAFLVADHDRATWETGDAIRVMLKS